jgi:GH35 family endo-1,4-beta-xylanase
LADKFEHRKHTATLHAHLPDGLPAVGVSIEARQKTHRFMFGCGGFEALNLWEGKNAVPADSKDRAFIEDRLEKAFAINNYATLPFYLGAYEPEEGQTDEDRMRLAAQWYSDRGVRMKGHPLCWHTACADWLMKYSDEEIIQRISGRIKREVKAFKGSIDIWDVINEVVIMPIFDKYDNALTRACKKLGRVGLVKEAFASAKEANPCALLILNDFNVSSSYEDLIDACLQAGVPIDAIGIQSHQHQGYWGEEKILEVLDRFSRFGLPIHFTENTIISGELMPAFIDDLNDWQTALWPSTPEGEERQARELSKMYEILFAHPLVQAITFWDSADGGWLNAPSGLLRADNSLKPAYIALNEKINGQWRTNERLAADAAGKIRFRGFLGDYEAKAENGLSGAFSLDKREEIELFLS